jgi:hypothetical protein
MENLIFDIYRLHRVLILGLGKTQIINIFSFALVSLFYLWFLIQPIYEVYRFFFGLA